MDFRNDTDNPEISGTPEPSKMKITFKRLKTDIVIFEVRP